MVVYRSSSSLTGAIQKKFKSPVVAIGNFDGVHLGHQLILRKAVQRAKKIKTSSMVYTFYPPPAQVLRPHILVPQISTLKERLKKFEEFGIDIVVIEKFSRKFSRKSAVIFFDQIIRKNLNTKILYVGYNFCFGRNREGNVDFLKKKCAEHKIEFHKIKPYKKENEIISSTKIRTEILEGNVKKAALFLGRPYTLTGKVIRGKRRGFKLGIPTANIKTDAELIPKEGVYITQTELNRRLYPSVTSIGRAVTFSENAPFAIETHILDFKQSLYGKSLVIHFLDRIRDIQKFNSIDELVAKMRQDIQIAKKRFKNAPEFRG